MRLREAAEIFYSINFFEAALECFCDSGDYERAGMVQILLTILAGNSHYFLVDFRILISCAGRIYLEKFSVPELRKAGECFSLARNYTTAAEVYAKGNFFRECLSACNKGNHFDMGLQYIKKWKKHALLNGVFTASIQAINEFEQKFLEKKALECYRSKDNASLLETVRAFTSMVASRKFLKSLDCLEELLVLEEESGNFNEAAEIARSLGSILREIDLLEKAEKFEDACMLILSFVVSRSLWVSGNRGWPLKSFPEKVKLLDRAMWISKKVSGTFHASICVEAEVLKQRQRNLSELNQSYVASKRLGFLTGEILCVRKLLDSHFEGKPCEYLLDSVLHVDTKSFHDILSRNQVSIGSLVFVWNLWKVQTMKILECLDSNKKLDFMKSESSVEFCCDYFGIRKFPDKAAAYHLLNPDAAWARNVDKNSIQNREVVTLEAYAFARVAREFWHEEFISVGLRVMDVLQEVYKSCSRSKCSQSMCLLHIFTIAKFFLSSKSVKLKGVDASKVQGFLQLSSKFFDLVFPLDFRQSSSANMVSLRETALSRNLLEEILCRNIQTSSSNLSHRQIGQAVMILLGCGKPSYGLLDKISKGLPKGSSWMSFIENLRTIDKPGSSIETLIPVSHEALEETYNNANWRTSDYISPNCFFYLVERLVVSVPRSEGIIFASKSSFVEYLMCLPSGAHPMSVLFADEKSYPAAGIVEFVGRVVENSLASIEEMSEWIEISIIDCAYYLPVLMLKMVVIMCLLCLNWDFPVDRLHKNLNVPHIRDQLPNKFHEALQRGLNNGTSFLAAVAEAFAAIGDPLVIVASGESDLKAAAHPNAVFLNLRSFSWKKELMKALL